MRLIMLPTWLLSKLLRSKLPDDHPWKYTLYTLKDWAATATDVNMALSMGLWCTFLLGALSFAALVYCRQ